MSPNPIVDDRLPSQGDLLIVDDVADNLRVLSNALSDHGYRVRGVKSGAMALLGAKTLPPDLILLDIRMPEMDGYEVCQRLKADPQTCHIPVIFLSALDEEMDKARAFEIGGTDYITKPFQVEEVLVRVKNQMMIQQLKKRVAEQKQQLEQITANSPCLINCAEWENIYSHLLSAITTILEYSDRLSQNPAIDQEQYAGLGVIHQNGQNLLNLVGSLLASKDATV